MDAKLPDQLVSAFAGAPSGRGYEAFREEICRSFCRLDVEPSADGKIDCVVDIRQLSSLALGVPRGTSARFARTRPLLSDSRDDFVLVTGTSGRTPVVQRGQSIELSPFEMCLLEVNVECAAALAADNRFATIRMPRRAMLEICPKAEDHLAKPLRENQPLRQLIARYAALSAETAADLDPTAQRLAAQHLIDLIARLLGTGRDETELASRSGRSAARLRLIESDIVAHIADSDLSIASTARRQGLSPKTLQRMFERAGKTFTAFVLEHRLAHARRLLATPGNRGRKIAELAFAAGFGDLSYFNRMFRRNFGMTPSEWRALPRNHAPA